MVGGIIIVVLVIIFITSLHVDCFIIQRVVFKHVESNTNVLSLKPKCRICESTSVLNTGINECFLPSSVHPHHFTSLKPVIMSQNSARCSFSINIRTLFDNLILKAKLFLLASCEPTEHPTSYFDLKMLHSMHLNIILSMANYKFNPKMWDRLHDFTDDIILRKNIYEMHLLPYLAPLQNLLKSSHDPAHVDYYTLEELLQHWKGHRYEEILMNGTIFESQMLDVNDKYDAWLSTIPPYATIDELLTLHGLNISSIISELPSQDFAPIDEINFEYLHEIPHIITMRNYVNWWLDKAVEFVIGDIGGFKKKLPYELILLLSLDINHPLIRDEVRDAWNEKISPEDRIKIQKRLVFMLHEHKDFLDVLLTTKVELNRHAHSPYHTITDTIEYCIDNNLLEYVDGLESIEKCQTTLDSLELILKKTHK